MKNLGASTTLLPAVATTGKMVVHTDAYQVLDKIVKSLGNSGGILIHKKWMGKMVKVLLLEDVDEED